MHVEITRSLSTDSFLMALMRSVNRRGTPEVMFSDTGSNFVGAESELRNELFQLDEKMITDKLLVRGIEWRFNPSGCTHRGGIWERMIR